MAAKSKSVGAGIAGRGASSVGQDAVKASEPVAVAAAGKCKPSVILFFRDGSARNDAEVFDSRAEGQKRYKALRALGSEVNADRVMYVDDMGDVRSFKVR